MKWLSRFFDWLKGLFLMNKFGLPVDASGNIDPSKILKAYCLEFNGKGCMIAILLETGWEYYPYSEELNDLLVKTIPKKYETFPITSGAMNLLVNQNIMIELSNPLANIDEIKRKYGI